METTLELLDSLLYGFKNKWSAELSNCDFRTNYLTKIPPS